MMMTTAMKMAMSRVSWLHVDKKAGFVVTTKMPLRDDLPYLKVSIDSCAESLNHLDSIIEPQEVVRALPSSRAGRFIVRDAVRFHSFVCD